MLRQRYLRSPRSSSASLVNSARLSEQSQHSSSRMDPYESYNQRYPAMKLEEQFSLTNTYSPAVTISASAVAQNYVNSAQISEQSQRSSRDSYENSSRYPSMQRVEQFPWNKQYSTPRTSSVMTQNYFPYRTEDKDMARTRRMRSLLMDENFAN